MNDNHTFVRLWGTTPRHMAQFATLLSERPMHRSGMLCNVSLLDRDGKELRQVGPNVHRRRIAGSNPSEYEPLETKEWIRCLVDDPDVAECMNLDREVVAYEDYPPRLMRLWETTNLKLRTILEAMSMRQSLYSMNAPSAWGYEFVQDQTGEIICGSYAYKVPRAEDYDGFHHWTLGIIIDLETGEYVPDHQLLQQLLENNGIGWDVKDGRPVMIEQDDEDTE